MNYFDEQLLQSYVRGPNVEEEEPSRLYQQPQPKKEESVETKEPKKEKQPKERRDSTTPAWMRRRNMIVIEQRKVKTVPLAIDECYCDKDRAAAVSFGYMDIKYDLKLKQTTDKGKVRIMPDDTDAMAFLMLGMREIKYNNLDNGVRFLSKAIEMSPNDQGALIARSKCYLQLGEPEKALLDAETAIEIDKNSIRAIYQKAEALYYLGKFEHSLMFFHRGLRLRPELNNFRLGVQKTQEAIENTIGGCQHKIDPRHLAALQKSDKFSQAARSLSPASSTNTRKTPKQPMSREAYERRQSRKLLGELFVDKEYLENLLKHPDLKRADTKTENVSGYAKDAIAFLNNRQEFWRQQKPTNILSSGKAINETIPLMSASKSWKN